jgi:hypothetical protein
MTTIETIMNATSCEDFVRLLDDITLTTGRKSELTKTWLAKNEKSIMELQPFRRKLYYNKQIRSTQNRVKNRKEWTDEELRYIYTAYKSGHVTYPYMADQMERSIPAIRHKISCIKIGRKLYKTVVEYNIEIIEYINAGCSDSEDDFILKCLRCDDKAIAEIYQNIG